MQRVTSWLCASGAIPRSQPARVAGGNAVGKALGERKSQKESHRVAGAGYRVKNRAFKWGI